MIDGDATGAAVVWTGSRLRVWGIRYSPGNTGLTSAGFEFAPPGS